MKRGGVSSSWTSRQLLKQCAIRFLWNLKWLLKECSLLTFLETWIIYALQVLESRYPEGPKDRAKSRTVLSAIGNWNRKRCKDEHWSLITSHWQIMMEKDEMKKEGEEGGNHAWERKEGKKDTERYQFNCKAPWPQTYYGPWKLALGLRPFDHRVTWCKIPVENFRSCRFFIIFLSSLLQRFFPIQSSSHDFHPSL